MEAKSEQEVDGPLLLPDTVFSALSPSRYFACGIRQSDSRVECFRIRENAGSIRVFDSDEWVIAPADEFSTVRSASTYACGITIAGEVRCWGNLEDVWASNEQPWGDALDRSRPFPGLVADRLLARSWTLCARSAETHALSCIDTHKSERPIFDPSVAYTEFDGMYTGGCALREADNKIDCWGSYSTADFDDQSYAGDDLPYR